MANFTIKQLRYFEALAQHRHFGRAAEARAVSQPALSVQIRELEQTLGAQLFERTARQVHLTAFGEAFGKRVRDILRQVDDLSDFARAAQGGLAGRFRLGVIPTIAPYLLPQVIGQLSRSHPGLDLHVRETQTPRLEQELLRGQIDAAIVALPVSDPNFVEVPLFAEHFVLVQGMGQENASAPGVEDLRNMRLLLLEEGHCLRDQTLAYCDIRAAAPRDGLDGSSLSTLVQMVGAGIGATLIPEMAVAVETRSAKVTCRRLKPPQPGRTIGMIWRKSSPLGDAYRDIASVVRRAAKDGDPGQIAKTRQR